MKPNMKKKYHPVPMDSLSHRLVLSTGTLGSSLAFIHPKSTGMKKTWYFWDGLLAFNYYKTGLCSWPFVPAAFGPGTIGGFCPGSNG